MNDKHGYLKRLADLLVDAGLIDDAQLQQALRVQQQTGERLGRVLVSLGLVSERDILNVLEMQLGIPQTTLIDKLNKQLVRTLPEALLRRHKVVPVKREGRCLMVATSDPLDNVAIDDLRLVTGLEIVPVLAGEREIENVLQKTFSPNAPDEPDGRLTIEEQPVGTVSGEYVEDGAPVIRLVDSIIARAIRVRASDIHIEPQESKVLVRFRQDGLLREVVVLSPQSRLPLISRLKIMAGLDITEKRLPQDGHIQIKFAGRNVDLRVSSLPTIFGEKIVLRILDKGSSLLPIEALGFDDYNFTRFINLLRHSGGMILITGPTGSGKTTTLYAVLNKLRTPALNIQTIEDPVEYVLEGINQTQVNVKAGLTFAAGLRSILRQDPDIIMVGEIRDRETAEIAVRAATTGHLVLSTLHTSDAAGALTRLIDMDVEPFLVASTVLGVVSQRLVRVLCPRCRQSYQPSPDAPERMFAGTSLPNEVTLCLPGGCEHCDQTGYRGRISIQEVLNVTGGIRNMINQKCSAGEIKRQAIQEGMITLRQDGVQKALRGITTLQEVMRVAYSEDW
ncbi:MAG: ATPase, T2SS/T4P/T4SS family [Bacillota bacterium]